MDELDMEAAGPMGDKSVMNVTEVLARARAVQEQVKIWRLQNPEVPMEF